MKAKDVIPCIFACYVLNGAATVAGEPLKFRGLHLGMSIEQARAVIAPMGFKLSDYNYFTDREGNPCAQLNLDQDNNVESMTLWQCYFDAEGYALRQFTQEIVNAYDLELDSFSNALARSVEYGYQGVAKSGEKIVVLERRDKFGIHGPRLEVSRGVRGKFD